MTHESQLLEIYNTYQRQHQDLRSQLANAKLLESMGLPTISSSVYQEQLNILNEKMALIEPQVTLALAEDKRLADLEAQRLADIEAQRMASITTGSMTQHSGIIYNNEIDARNQITSMVSEINSLKSGYSEQARQRSAWGAQELRTWSDQYFARITLLSQQVEELILVYKRMFLNPNFPDVPISIIETPISVIPIIQPIDVTLNTFGLEGSQVTGLIHDDRINIIDFTNTSNDFTPLTSISKPVVPSDVVPSDVIPSDVVPSDVVPSDVVPSKFPNWIFPIIAISTAGVITYFIVKNKKSKLEKNDK